MKFTDAEVKSAIRDSGGILRDVINRLEAMSKPDDEEGKPRTISRQALWERIQKNDELSALWNDEREDIDDLGESALRKAVREGKPWAIQLWAKYRGRHRGYVELKQQENKDVDEFTEYTDDELEAVVKEA